MTRDWRTVAQVLLLLCCPLPVVVAGLAALLLLRAGVLDRTARPVPHGPVDCDCGDMADAGAQGSATGRHHRRPAAPRKPNPHPTSGASAPFWSTTTEKPR